MIDVATRVLEALGAAGKNLDARGIWRSQPNVRAVVEFLAFNLSQLGLHCFVRSGEDRERTRDSVAARLLARPAPMLTGVDLVAGLAADLALHDEALWLVLPADTLSGWLIRPVPVSRIVKREGSRYGRDGITFTVRLGDGESTQRFGPDKVVYFGGYSTEHDDKPTPRTVTLGDELRQQLDAATFRAQMWRSGLRVSQVVTRPSGRWSSEARAQFLEDLRAYADGGPRAGRPLLLEDGMTLNSAQFSSKEAQWLEATQLSLQTVCRMFQVNPAMVGSTGGVTYANMREFKRQLYGETLGPIVRRIEATLNAFLLPMLGGDPTEFVEFNIKEKLSGSFEEQADYMAKAIGGPWMTQNEGRGTQNYPALPGGDDLLVPMNYTRLGDVPPSTDGGQNATRAGSKAGAARVKATASDESRDLVAAALEDFFVVQASEVRRVTGAKATGDWWDSARWNRALAAELYRVAMVVTRQVGRAALEDLGVDPSEYDADRTRAFLEAVAKSRAEWINDATRAQIADVLSWTPTGDQTEDDRPTVEGVFEAAKSGARHVAMASALVATFSGFATVEAGKQHGGTLKTWDTGPNARPAHAAMNGETVPVTDRFSNGAEYPGDAVLGADGVSGCNCSLILTQA